MTENQKKLPDEVDELIEYLRGRLDLGIPKGQVNRIIGLIGQLRLRIQVLENPPK